MIVGLARPQPGAPELAVLCSHHPRLMASLEIAAEVTYSRVSCFHEAYYELLFDGLRTSRTGTPPASVPENRALALPCVRPTLMGLHAAPAFARPAPEADVIRLDYGENELPLPRCIQEAILRGFLSAARRPSMDRCDRAARYAAAEYLRATRLPQVEGRQVVLDNGALPLLVNALRALSARLGRAPRVLLPRGSYGMFAPLLQAAGCVHLSLPTGAPDFLATPEAVNRAPDFDVLLLTNPANPSGASYTPSALASLIRAAAASAARVILDEVFGLLADLGGPLPLGQDRWAGLTAAEAKRVLLICGVSKEFAAGGLRLGLAATADDAWRRGIEAMRLDPVPHGVQVAADIVFSMFRERMGEIEALRRDLSRRRALLSRGLRSMGFLLPDDERRGGLFLFPDVGGLAPDDPERFVLALESRARVRLNAPSWSGTRSHARACFALPERTLVEALRRLEAFLPSAPAGQRAA